MIAVAFRYGDKRLFSRFVCWWQANDASHCEVVTRSVADAHECVSASYLDGGVRLKIMPLPPEKWRIYNVPGERAAALAWYFVHQGEGYDVLGLVGFVIRPIKGLLKRWFCSEACAAMLKLEQPWRMNVADLELHCARVGERIQ